MKVRDVYCEYTRIFPAKSVPTMCLKILEGVFVKLDTVILLQLENAISQ